MGFLRFSDSFFVFFFFFLVAKDKNNTIWAQSLGQSCHEILSPSVSQLQLTWGWGDGDGGYGPLELQTKSKSLAPSAGPKLFIRRAYTLAATTTTWRLAISGILTPCTASV